jgi:rsbT antagonist protein RsbS
VTELLPIMKIGDTLMISLQGDLDDTTVIGIEERLTREVAHTRATGTLIDVSGLTIVDSFIARVIARMAAMIRLLGSETAVVGIQPAVAITLVELGVPMGHIHPGSRRLVDEMTITSSREAGTTVVIVKWGR